MLPRDYCSSACYYVGWGGLRAPPPPRLHCWGGASCTHFQPVWLFGKGRMGAVNSICTPAICHVLDLGSHVYSGCLWALRGSPTVTGQTSAGLLKGGRASRRTKGRGNSPVRWACWHQRDWRPGCPAGRSARGPWVGPEPPARSTECCRISQWMRWPAAWAGAGESDISVYLSVKQNREELATDWFRAKEKCVWAFWLIWMRAVYSGALRGVRGDQGHLVPICVAWQEKKSQKLSWFHLLGWKSKAEWEFVFSRL